MTERYDVLCRETLTDELREEITRLRAELAEVKAQRDEAVAKRDELLNILRPYLPNHSTASRLISVTTISEKTFTSRTRNFSRRLSK